MKLKIILTLFISTIALVSSAQPPTGSFTYAPFFSAVVVKDMDSSIQWYQAVFSLTVTRKKDDPKTRFALLESSNFTVELLEIKGSLNRSEILGDNPEGTLIQGHLKIGFKVADLNACLKHLAGLKITPQIWTDKETKKRNFIISDPDGNPIQFFD